MKINMAKTTPHTSDTQVKRHSGKYVYDQLREEILTLKLRPGTQLDEISLAKRFNLSRSPIRDALARLAAEGLATTLANRTTIVSPFNIDDFPQYISALDLLQRAVTQLAALYRTDQDIKILKQLDVDYMKAVKNGDFHGMSELNKAFHIQIAKAGKNPYLIDHYEKLLEEGQRLLHLHFDYIVSSFNKIKLGNDHLELIAAIIKQDAKAAEKAAHQHTLLFQQRFIQFMQHTTMEDISLKIK